MALFIGELIGDLLGAAAKFFLGLLFGLLIGPVVAIAGVFCAYLLFVSANSLPSKEKCVKKSLGRVPRAKRVHLKDSPLFVACLQKIADGEIESLFVNTHMACFNFSGSFIDQSQMIDFLKLGYDPLEEIQVLQYMKLLERAARRLPNVVEVKRSSCMFGNQPYLISEGYYDLPGNGEMDMLEFKYRVVNKKKLKSFNF